MSENITIITDDSFDAEVIQSSIPVLVDFWAEWCGPCKMIAPTVEIVAKEFAGKIKVTKLNVDENNKIATSYNIRGIPTLMFFKDGNPVKTLIGAQSKDTLKREIDQVLSG